MLFNLAAISAFLAIPTLALASIYGVYFFKTRDPRMGLLNDVYSAIVLLLLILPVLAINVSQAPTVSWLDTVTWMTIVGLIIGAGGQFLLVFEKINLATSFITGGISLLPIIAWMGALIYLSLFRQSLSASIGWLSAAILLLVAMLPVTWAFLRATFSFLTALLLITLAAWLLSLGLVLLSI